MKRLTPEAWLARTIGSKQSKLMDLPRAGSSSKLGSFEMQARWITASQPFTAAEKAGVSRRSALTVFRRGWGLRPASP